MGETWGAWGSQGRGMGRTEAAGRRESRAQKVTLLGHAKRRAGGPWEVSRMASLASSSVRNQEGRDLGLPMIECPVGPLRDAGAVLPVAEAVVSCGAPDQARDPPLYLLVANLMIACGAASSAAALGFAAQDLEVGLEAQAERESAAVVELRILEVDPDYQEGKREVLEAFLEVQVACLEILEDPFVVQLILELKSEHRANSPQGPQH